MLRSAMLRQELLRVTMDGIYGANTASNRSGRRSTRTLRGTTTTTVVTSTSSITSNYYNSQYPPVQQQQQHVGATADGVSLATDYHHHSSNNTFNETGTISSLPYDTYSNSSNYINNINYYPPSQQQQQARTVRNQQDSDGRRSRRKWISVKRYPVGATSFTVKVWVPIDQLTHSEMEIYQQQQQQQQHQVPAVSMMTDQKSIVNEQPTTDGAAQAPLPPPQLNNTQQQLSSIPTTNVCEDVVVNAEITATTTTIDATQTSVVLSYDDGHTTTDRHLNNRINDMNEHKNKNDALTAVRMDDDRTNKRSENRNTHTNIEIVGGSDALQNDRNNTHSDRKDDSHSNIDDDIDDGTNEPNAKRQRLLAFASEETVEDGATQPMQPMDVNDDDNKHIMDKQSIDFISNDNHPVVALPSTLLTTPSVTSTNTLPLESIEMPIDDDI